MIIVPVCGHTDYQFGCCDCQVAHVFLQKKLRHHRWYKANKARVQEKTYGVTQATLAAMLAAQHNACAICKRLFSPQLPVHIDHDHRTNTVRGLLCPACNLGLGQFGDDWLRLLSAITYLTTRLPGEPPIASD